MNYSLITTELVKTIQEERLLQAQRRRLLSRSLVRDTPGPLKSMRMAAGPGTRSGEATQALDVAFDREDPARAA